MCENEAESGLQCIKIALRLQKKSTFQPDDKISSKYNNKSVQIGIVYLSVYMDLPQRKSRGTGKEMFKISVLSQKQKRWGLYRHVDVYPSLIVRRIKQIQSVEAEKC